MSTPIITTSAIPPGSTVYVLASASSGFQTSSFANDLFNSLAPLLTLFGEQPTRQYLSMSLSLADHILLGIAPIGLLTIVVSAIRISGSPLLKALVGRFRENKASIEAEVLSSTSTRVRELWDGERIVKEAGESRTIEVIYNQIPQRKTGKMLVQTFPDAVSGYRFSRMYRLQTKASGVGQLKRTLGWEEKASGGDNNSISEDHEPFLKERLQTEAPNISLNVPGAIASRAEIWTLGAVGYVLQFGVLAVAGLSVYRLGWRGSKDASIPAYAFPCFAAGTILITIFATICGYIIEATTKKEIYEPSYPAEKLEQNPYRVFRVQRESTVGRQDLPAYALFNDLADPLIRTARPNKRQFKALTLVSSTMAITGFAAQFIGIRAMHWSIALMQLGVTFITTGLRMWARRGVTHRPEVLPLESNREAVDLALHIRSCDKWELMTGKVAGAIWLHESPALTEPLVSQVHEEPSSLIRDLYRNADKSPEPSTKKIVRWLMGESVHFGDRTETPRNVGHRTMELHRRLQEIFPCDQEIENATSNICEAITHICNYIFSSKDVVLANLDTAGQLTDDYLRPSLDVLVKGKASRNVLSGLIELGFVVKWPVDGDCEIVSNDARKRIRSIISLTHRSLSGDNRSLLDGSIYRSETYFMRILGYDDSGGINLSEKNNRSPLRKWFDYGIHGFGYPMIPVPDGANPMLALDLSIETSPIFGMKFSSLCMVANLTMQLSSPDSVPETSLRKQREKKSSRSSPERPSPAASELVFLSATNLLNNIALDVLSTFMLTLTAAIENVGGITTEVEDTAHKRRRWENNVLEKLSQILIDIGLASNMEVAKSVIIPAFATRWLLPPKTAQTASEGMKNAQMPEDWTRRISESGRTYLANHKTKITSWKHPWYMKPDDLWQEIHSTTPPPAYTPPQEPKEPPSPFWGHRSRKPSYPPSLVPDQAHSRGAYLYKGATGSIAGPASIYSEVFLPREEGLNNAQAFPRPASR